MTSHAPFLTAGLGWLWLGVTESWSDCSHHLRRHGDFWSTLPFGTQSGGATRTVWQIFFHDDQQPPYATPSSTARSLRNVSAPLRPSISDPPPPPAPTPMCLGQACGAMIEVLFGLRRDIAHPSFPLQFDDELPGCPHPATIEQVGRRRRGLGMQATATTASRLPDQRQAQYCVGAGVLSRGIVRGDQDGRHVISRACRCASKRRSCGGRLRQCD